MVSLYFLDQIWTIRYIINLGHIKLILLRFGNSFYRKNECGVS